MSDEPRSIQFRPPLGAWTPVNIDGSLDVSTNELRVDLMYPRNEDGVSTVKVGLIDVRAADDLTIRYDFERDGYSITREVTRDGDGPMEGTGEWREVAFVAAWTEHEQPSAAISGRVWDQPGPEGKQSVGLRDRFPSVTEIRCLTCPATTEIDIDTLDLVFDPRQGKPEAVQHAIRLAAEKGWRVTLPDPLGKGTCPDCLAREEVQP